MCLKIAICHHYSLSHGGGGEKFVTELATYLASNGHEVSVHCLPFRAGKAPIKLPPNVKYCEKFLHSINSDVAYYVYAPLMYILFRTNRKRIAGMHGAIVASTEERLLDYKGQGIIVAFAYVFLKYFSKLDLKFYSSVHKLLPTGKEYKIKTYTIPNWTSNIQISTENKDYRKDPTSFVVMYVGKRSYAKGYDTFVKLSNMLSYSDIEFVATVDTDDDIGLNEERIRHIGYVDHDTLMKEMEKVHVLLHPTRQETFGIVILEALSVGTPVVTSSIETHNALGLPLNFASTLEDYATKVRELHDLWKNQNMEYRVYCENLRNHVERYYDYNVLPKFLGMFKEMELLFLKQ